MQVPPPSTFRFALVSISKLLPERVLAVEHANVWSGARSFAAAGTVNTVTSAATAAASIVTRARRFLLSAGPKTWVIAAPPRLLLRRKFGVSLEPPPCFKWPLQAVRAPPSSSDDRAAGA